MITLEANYSKKIGLPGFSSHQFCITLRTELTDLNQVQSESNRLYDLLQRSVDASIQSVGYLPDGNGNGHKPLPPASDVWACSEKQQKLILQIVEENKLDKAQVEALSKERFNTPVKALNKLQASSLIEELLERYPLKGQNGHRRYQRAGAR